MNSTSSFDIDGFADIDALERVNETLRDLSQRLRPKIEVRGPLARSKLAWKIAVYQQATLHRVVMLTEGARSAWNERNVVTGFLTSRALIETVAVVSDFGQRLGKHVQERDLQAIDALVMNRTFSSRDDAMLVEWPNSRAVNILTTIDKLDQDIPGVRAHYDLMSERCHPNSMGHHQLFAVTDHSNGDVAFTTVKNLHQNLEHIFAGVFLLGIVPGLMDGLDRSILRVAELQHRLNPVEGR